MSGDALNNPPDNQAGETGSASSEASAARPLHRSRCANARKRGAKRSSCSPPTIIPPPVWRTGQAWIWRWSGDSLGAVVLGYKNVVPVTLDDIPHHVRAVRRGLKYALLVADMPFGTYQASVEDAVHNAVTLLKAGAEAVKLEGGAAIAPDRAPPDRCRHSRDGASGTDAAIHPSVWRASGAGRDCRKTPQRMLADARALEAAGAFGMVLETIPAALAAQITAAVAIPTIGIGAGAACDGQVQVWHDILGLGGNRTFRHAKRYAEIGEIIETAVREYADEVRDSRFPTREHSL